MARPRVDVVVPFAGPAGALRELCVRLRRLELAPEDSLTVVDNRLHAPPDTCDRDPIVLAARELGAPGYARNRGAARGSAEWIVFFDADVLPAADLIDGFFDPPPAPGTGTLAGGARESPAPAAAREPAAARYARLRGLMNQDNSLAHGRWAFVQTVSCAVRREAFEAVGGFRDDARAGEDADLTYRLQAAGWRIERREGAQVLHRSRQTIRAMLGQQASHGAGAAWLNGVHPGSFPARRWPGLLWWGTRRAVRGLAEATVTRDRDAALTAVIDPLNLWAFELGRLRSNQPRRQSREGAPR